MRFDWDRNKAKANLAKHGISFVEAVTAFEDPSCRSFEDLVFSERRHLIAYSATGKLLTTIYEERGESTRIISSRKATPGERKRYEEAPR